ncbi:hypothetical protein B296_00048669 [Ensete ventricosum]|uniref:C2H2-type domain-containing protein n=1 Tax=Ensete ventricosum TaxID=4639 RepID=A0A426YTY3_ENSVE|nr:hypothetical protein B296_00048669 [Ensete ventricosum]
MKPGKEGQDSLNNIIRQAIEKETLLSVCRTGDNPVHWIHLLQCSRPEDSCSSKDSGSTIKGTKTSSEQMQALKIPEAVLAFAQAAARANDLPGWPLFSPAKMQLQKCEKCYREFCSMINYRRHILVHRRTLKIDKDFPRNREYLGTFWDKLSSDKAEEILSFTNMSIEVKSWVADKDAEALRCHKLLMEEEEAAQRRYLGDLTCD